MSDIQDYIYFIFEKHDEKINNPSTRIYVNKTENRITFKTKTGYYLDPLTTETIVLVALVYCYSVSNDYQQDSRVLHTFIPSEPFGSLLYISQKTFNSKFQAIEVWRTDQNSQPLEVQERINLTVVIK